jgi:hypothetical protein
VERLLARLERSLGKYAIPNLTNYIVGGMIAVFVLAFVRPDFIPWISLDIASVRQGQVWRLFSYLFIPSSMSILWFFMNVGYLLFIGRSLESEWGTFKFNVYYLVGMIGTTVGAVIIGHGVGNVWLNYSLTFALATVFPEHEISLIIIPIRLKWVGLLTFAYLLFSAAAGDWYTRVAIVCALSNYILFFAGHWRSRLQERNREVRQGARRAGFRESAPPKAGGKSCAICGARQDDGADIRVCTCEKCGRPRSLCLEHARNH